MVINERKEYADHVWKASKKQHSNWTAKRVGEEGDELITDMYTEDPELAQMEQNE